MVQKQTTLAWDDLRVALHVARAGSMRKAARTLGVSHSTVLRRIAELEQAARARLFERKEEGYELTSAGQDAVDTARELEDVVTALERRVDGLDLRLEGPIRVTLPDPLLPALLPYVKTFGEVYPDIEVTLAVGVGYLDLAQREADVAVRIAAEPPPELVGRRAALVGSAVYGSERYLAGRPTKDLARLDWVGWQAGSTMAFSRWMSEHVPKARVAVRVDSSWALRDAVDAELGVALLPCPLGDAKPTWRRLRVLPELRVPLWVLTHRDLRATARVRALRDFLFEAITRERTLYEGRKQGQRTGA
jgi:DNA-binding transcriptional LysR family regulator